MIKLISLLLVLTPIILAQQQNSTNTGSNSCWFVSKGNYYDLSPLVRDDGVAWSAKDNNGVTWYFNFCNSLNSFADHQVGCSASSGVCIETIYGTFFNGGLPNSEWQQLDDQENVITTTYVAGDACHNTKENFKLFQTQFILTCSAEDLFTVTSLSYKNCETVIHARSHVACPLDNDNTVAMALTPVSAFFLSFFLTFALCMCCITCCYRSRRARFTTKGQVKKGGYTKLKTVETQTPEMPPTAEVTPSIPPPSYFAYLPSQPFPQQNYYYPPPAPYFYGPQTPVYGNNELGYNGNAMVTPIVPLEELVNEPIDQIAEDEKLARQLQDQLDRQ